MQILRAIKSRCGGRLKRGDFALTSDALVLAVRDRRSANTNTGATFAEQQLAGGDDGGVFQNRGRDGGNTGDVVAVMELTLRQPDGWLPFNGLFVVSQNHADCCLVLLKRSVQRFRSAFRMTWW